ALSAVRFFGLAEPSTGTSQRSKFVDQASSLGLGVSLAEKTSARESGGNAISSGPPNGFDGGAAFMPRVTSTEAAVLPTPRTKRCERVPSLQVSQCRTMIES